MQAIILAAGMGKRLKELTRDNTKCMVKVNGVSLIERMLRQLEQHNLSRVVIVVGYESRKLMDYIATLNIRTPIVYIENTIYDKTNNIYSLTLAKQCLVEDDTLLFESDIIVEDSIISQLIEDQRDTLALVDRYQSWMDGTCVTLGENDEITAFVPGKKFDFHCAGEYYKTVNIYKFSKAFSCTHYVPFLEAYQKALGENEYYEQVLRVITMLDEPIIKGRRLHGELWYEIDDAQDLDIASSLFASDETRVELMSGRYGGYWRYPGVTDFCYLVNPYFPPQKMIDEMKASFATLLTQYPSGMRVNSLLASKNFDVYQENIVVGNGAAELIKALMEKMTGKLGIIRPTFEEYGHRYSEKQIVAYRTDRKDFGYTADDVMEYFENHDIKTLILINPDNPSGNYICREDLLRLVEWTKEKKIRFVVDESFVDFSDELNATLIRQTVLNQNPHLAVMKSISKSYGVPGLRLGILASGDRELIADLKRDVAIWNINSFAEFYMQIAEKYKSSYISALEQFRKERARYVAALSEIEGLRVLPSQANYVMAELTSGMTSGELTGRLLVEHGIIIKNLAEKLLDDGGQFVRLAVRTAEEDDRLVQALRSVLQKKQ